MFREHFGFLLHALKRSSLPVSLNNKDTAYTHKRVGIAREVVIGRKDAIEGRTPPHKIRHTPRRHGSRRGSFILLLPLVATWRYVKGRPNQNCCNYWLNFYTAFGHPVAIN